MTSSEMWTREAAQGYDESDGIEFQPEVITQTVDLLHGLADGGRALELAIGTGRIAIPLLERGTPVEGIDYSPAMLERLREKVSVERLPAVEGDMATMRVDGEFALVYLVFNSISNLLTQDEQVECFRNAARHLQPMGRFVVELWVPPLRRMAPGPNAVVTSVSEHSIGFDTYDLATQACTSQGYRPGPDGSVRHGLGHFRYAWPAELDLMARLAGLELELRYADWDARPFDGDSPKHLSVWRKPAA